MTDDFRHFTAGPDPFGRTWKVDFRWLQTAISIRHSDSVDVKFTVSHEQREEEKIIALQHKDLLALSDKAGRALTDPWCMKLASLHLRKMILTGEDMEKTLVTMSLEDLEEQHNALLKIQDKS